MMPKVVSTYLDKSFGGCAVFALPGADQRKLVATCEAQRIVGSAIYDALIAATCTHGSIKLLTLDARAHQIYALLGADHEMVA